MTVKDLLDVMDPHRDSRDTYIEVHDEEHGDLFATTANPIWKAIQDRVIEGLDPAEFNRVRIYLKEEE